MNKERRKQIAEIAEQIGALKDRLEELRDAEQESFDNMPEGLLRVLIGQTMHPIAIGPMGSSFLVEFTDEEYCHICKGDTKEEAMRQLLIVAREQSWRVFQELN